MLLHGEQELADKLLELTKTARDADATFPEQATILRQMGELYLKNAIETGNGEQFVKASALINAALVRTEDEREHYPLHEILCNIYTNFMKNIVSETLEFTVDTLIDRTNSNQEFLHTIRVEIDKMCEKLKFYFYSKKTGDISTKQMEEQIIHEAEKVSSRVQTSMIEFIRRLWGQATELLSVSPPCGYAVIGLGSLARQETTPFSDLEFALLLETNTEENNQYFKNLVHLFHLLVLDLGETPIPDIAIESLNDFMSPDGDKYFDGITPRGFRLDAAMPWACKTPIGRKQTALKEPLDLIKHPEEMAALLQEDNVLGQSYHVSDILSNSILICGDVRLFEKYAALRRNIILKTNYKERARKSIIEDNEKSPESSLLRYTVQVPYTHYSKTDFYRYPSTFVENLRMYFTPDYHSDSNLKILDHLFEKQILSEQGVFNLKAQMAVSYGLRILTYLHNRGQYESFEYLIPKQRNFDKDRKKESVKQRSRSRLAHFGNGAILGRIVDFCSKIKYIVETYFMEEGKDKVHDLIAEDFIPEQYPLGVKLTSWNRNRVIFGNLKWARSSRELPYNGCGQACGVDKLSQLSHIPEDDYLARLKALDEILDIKGCKCLSLLRTSLLVSKAILIAEGDAVGSVPGAADARKLLTRYQQKQYRNVRERFYLLFDICDLAELIFDKNESWIITGEIEDFFDDIQTFDKTQQKIANMMKIDFFRLIPLYKYSKQIEKGVQLCQREIDRLEREHGLDGGKFSVWYYHELKGDLLSMCDRHIEALDSYNQGLNLNLELYENVNFASAAEIHKRQSAKKIGDIYSRLGKNEDAITVLKNVFTKNGEIVDIKTDVDIEAMCRLCAYFVLKAPSEKHIREGNQYLEKILESIIGKLRGFEHKLSPCTVIKVAAALHVWITCLIGGSVNPSFVVENLCKEYCRGQCSDFKAKKQFLTEILRKLINNESTYTYFLERKSKKIQYKTSSSPLLGWDDFIFAFCSLCVSSRPILENGMTLLTQIEIFCENVVKKCASKNIYEMCLVYINFQEAKIKLSYPYFNMEEREHGGQTTIEFVEKLHFELLQYFPNCRIAQKATERNTIRAMFKYRVKSSKVQ